MNKEIYGIIYKVTCLINNKIYIGQTTQTINERKNQHLSSVNNGEYDPIEYKDKLNEFRKEKHKLQTIKKILVDKLLSQNQCFELFNLKQSKCSEIFLNDKIDPINILDEDILEKIKQIKNNSEFDNKKVKLEEDVKYINFILKNKLATYDICSKLFNIGHSTVNKIATGKYYKEIEDIDKLPDYLSNEINKLKDIKKKEFVRFDKFKEKAKEVKKLKSDGKTVKECVNILGVSKSFVGKVFNGSMYADVS